MRPLCVVAGISKARRLGVAVAPLAAVGFAIASVAVFGSAGYPPERPGALPSRAVLAAGGPAVGITFPGLPTKASVRRLRYVQAVGLDNRALTVDPAPPGEALVLAASGAWAKVYSAAVPTGPAVAGGPFIAFGVGRVTLQARLNASLPASAQLHRTLAWVAFSRFLGPFACPYIGSSKPPRLPVGAEPDSGYQAVIVTAAGFVIAYRSRTSICMEPYTPPRAELAQRLVSVPWLPGSGPDRVRYLAPGCARMQTAGYFGGPGEGTIQVVVIEPYAGCGPKEWRELSGTWALPALHAALGPVGGAAFPLRPPPPLNSSATPFGLPAAPGGGSAPNG